MVWGGYAVLKSGKTDSITFWVVSREALLFTAKYKQNIKIGEIMGQTTVGPAELWKGWPRQSSVWSASGM
ncbi:hypothetical protein Tco_1164309 [Tanacetum coccineum]